MNDRPGEPPHDGQSFRLHYLIQVLPVKLAQPIADLTQQHQRQRRGTAHQLQHLLAIEKIDGRRFPGYRARRPRLVLDYRHLPENIARFDLRKNVPRVFPNQSGDFHQTFLDAIKAVAGVSFLEDFLSLLERAFGRDFLHRFQLVRVELTEYFAGFERDHRCTVEKSDQT